MGSETPAIARAATGGPARTPASRPAAPTAAHGEPLVQLRGVTLRRGERTILDAIDFAWNGDGLCALVGANGAGKTVLLRTLHGLLEPDAGEVRFEGRARGHDDLAFAGQALVFQHPSMFRGTALENLMLAPAADGRRMARNAQRERALAMLDRVGLASFAAVPALKLSGGERQRLAIARAWLTQPRLLLLDEPTASLDPSATEQVEALVRDVRTTGCRVLFTSHNLGQIARLADEVVFLHAGRVLERQPTAAFFEAPRCAQARDYLQGALPWPMRTNR